MNFCNSNGTGRCRGGSNRGGVRFFRFREAALRRLLAVVPVFLVLFLSSSGCNLDPDAVGGVDQPCASGDRCDGDLVCIRNICQNVSVDGDQPSQNRFGDACATNSDCLSGICQQTEGLTYCSAACQTDEECQDYQADTCCDSETETCRLPSQCEDTPPETCRAEGRRCNGSDVERCNTAGEWLFYRDCLAEAKTCFKGECIGFSPDGDESPTDGDEFCQSGAKRCEGDTVVRCNDSGAGWKTFVVCPQEDICLNGECFYPPGESCTLAEGCWSDLEYCLPDQPGGEEGACVPFCDLPEVHCPLGWQCKSGMCQPIEGYCQGDSDCEMDEFCNRLPGASDGLCTRYCELPGESCPEGYTCVDSPPENPNYGRCVPLDATCVDCEEDSDCESGQYCERVVSAETGCCRQKCGLYAPCVDPLVCDTDGRCVVGSGQGDCSYQCPVGHVCDPTFNQCVLACPPCGENQCCDASSAPNCYECVCENPMICGVLLQQCCYGFTCSALVYGVLGFCI